MKVAWCFSGQIRTGIESSQNILNFINRDMMDIDFFIHTWDIESMSYHEPPYMDSEMTNVPYPLDKSKVDKIIEIYQPKKILISDYEKYQESVLTNPRFIDNTEYVIPYTIPLYQSAYESNKLKMEYEKENGFKYDYVIKSRFDIEFFPHQNLWEELLFIQNRFRQDNINEVYVNDYWNKLPGMMEDIFWVGESEVMDILSNFIDYLMDMETDPPKDRQILMYNYVTKKLGIRLHPMKTNDLKLLRMFDILNKNKYILQ